MTSTQECKIDAPIGEQITSLSNRLRARNEIEAGQFDLDIIRATFVIMNRYETSLMQTNRAIALKAALKPFDVSTLRKFVSSGKCEGHPCNPLHYNRQGLLHLITTQTRGTPEEIVEAIKNM